MPRDVPRPLFQTTAGLLSLTFCRGPENDVIEIYAGR